MIKIIKRGKGWKAPKFTWEVDLCSCKPLCDACKLDFIDGMKDIEIWPKRVFAGLPDAWKPIFLEQWLIRKIKREG